MQEHLADEGVAVSSNTVSNILHEGELHGRRLRKTPLLKEVHLKARLKFAREHVEKGNILETGFVVR